MIDLHTHILPGIDDGAASVDEAVKLTEALFNQNILTAVCTPHYDPTKTSINDFAVKRESAMNLMKGSRIALIPASETLLHEYLFHYPDLKELCIGNTRYLLLEMPFDKKWNRTIYETLETLAHYFNIIPVIAHIERYESVIKNRKLIKKLKNMGCLIQMNTSSIVNKETSHFAVQLIKQDFIDVLGSDCHSMDKRPPVIKEALELLEKNVNQEIIRSLDYNSECIKEGIEIYKKNNYILD